ncbi:hypothetical protein ACVOMV_18150 [Mesorhizobium atlanticum]
MNLPADLAHSEKAKKDAFELVFKRIAIPNFTSPLDEKKHRKERLAGGFRIFCMPWVSVKALQATSLFVIRSIPTHSGSIHSECILGKSGPAT